MQKMSSQRFLRELGNWGFLMPHFFFFLLFVAAPLIVNSVLSFYNWKLIGTPKFIEFTNYVRIWTDNRFWETVKNTIFFAIISIPITIAVALIFALILNQKIYGKLWLLICFVSPTFFGSVGILTTWKWIYASHPTGLLNYYLVKFGILEHAVSWFETAGRAWACVIISTTWWIVGFSVLLYLGAIQRIPIEQYEAAKVDGAGPLRRFWHVTVPWIRSVLFFDVVRQVLLAFGLFDQVYFFTAGGPAGKTRTMVFYLYQTGFNRQELGRAAAISWYIFFVVIIFGVVQLGLVTRSIKSTED